MKVFFSKLSQAFMLPIALLPAAGIMLGVGGSFTNESMVDAYGLTFLENGTILNNFLTIMTAAGGIVFDNLPLLFAIALAVGFAKREKGAAALAATIAYLIMNVSISTTISVLGLSADSTNEAGEAIRVLVLFGNEYQGMFINVLGITESLSMGVFGGIIAGGVTAVLHNRYFEIKLPEYLGFFAGPRFVPIISAFAALFYGIALVFIWPFFGVFFNSIGEFLGVLSNNDQGYIASLIFGLVERSLIPVGLHHVFYLPLWQTSVGGSATFMTANGQEIVYGTQNIFFSALETGNWDPFTSTNFMTGKFPFMMFGLPAAAYAMYTLTDDENKKEAGGLLFSVAATSFLTGITEPIEFTFLFLAPGLYYFVHVPLAGISFMLMDLLNVRVGMTFSGGAIDFLLFGVLPGTIGGVDNNWYFIPLVGIVYAFVYFFIFRFYIVKFDVATPGRKGAEVKVVSKVEYRNSKEKNSSINLKNEDSVINYFENNVVKIVEALGGIGNIDEVSNCISRLRISVKDASLVNEDRNYWTTELSAKGLVLNGKSIQAIYGGDAAQYTPLIEEMFEN